MMLALYREAFESHVDRCDQCTWVGLHLCHIGRKLQRAHADACAAAMVPIPTIHRAAAKA